MSTHMSEFQSFFKCFASFGFGQISHQQRKGQLFNAQISQNQPDNFNEILENILRGNIIQNIANKFLSNILCSF